MTRLPLRLGPFDLPNVRIARSSLQWLLPDGHECRAGEPVAFCALSVGGWPAGAEDGDRVDLQVALAPRVSGRLRHAASASRGGILDRIPWLPWDPAAIWAHVERPAGETESGEDEPSLLFLAGRRFTGIADTRTGLLNGWHDSTRAWWGEGDRHGMLVGAGICEQDAILRGADDAYRGLFALAAGPAHAVHGQDEPLVPSARVLAEQLARTAGDRAAIREDVARTFGNGGPVPAPREWIFIAALLNALERAPLAERHDIVTRRRAYRTELADAVCLSLTGELSVAARHRRLGYTLNCHGFVLAAAGPAVTHWVRTNFEPVVRTPDDVAHDYRALADAVDGRPLFVVNAMSTFAYEAIRDYRGLDAATMRGLGSVRAKDLNLMLHDLTRTHNVAIVDADAIAADLGMAAHLPDGVHGSGAFYGEIRAELVRQLDVWGVPGFSRRLG